MKRPGISAISWGCIMALAITSGFFGGCGNDEGGDSHDYTETRTVAVFNPSASGTYEVDGDHIIIEIYQTSFVSSDYDCDGPNGTMILEILFLDATTMTLLDFDYDEETTWTRDPGVAGDIEGEWEMEDEYGDKWDLVFDDDGNVFIQLNGSMTCYITEGTW